MAAALAEGANTSLIAINSEGNITEQDWVKLSEVDVILSGSTTYMGGPSYIIKLNVLKHFS